MENKETKCPKCGNEKNQHKKGFTRSGSRRTYCNVCKYKYTPNAKSRAYSEEKRMEALRLPELGNTGRGVGKALGMSKSNAYRWTREEVKKRESLRTSPETNFNVFVFDEIYWFTNTRKEHENGINTYIVTLVSWEPRQIVALEVENSVRSEHIQAMIDRSPKARKLADRRDTRKDDDFMRDPAIRAYWCYMPERARLRACGEWNAQAQSTLRSKAVYLAERTMTKELFEWVESHFANPKDWKEAVIASAVEATKPIVKRMSRRKK